MNWDRAIVGYACTFGRRVAGHDPFDAGHFAGFLRLGMGIPLRLNHGPVIRSSGVLPAVGVCRYFRCAPTSSGLPAGLLVAAEVDPGPVGDGLLAAAAQAVRPGTWGPRSGLWAMSVGVRLVDRGGRLAEVWPEEVSVTGAPADPGASVLAVGEAAAGAWELLTGLAAAEVVA